MFDHLLHFPSQHFAVFFIVDCEAGHHCLSSILWLNLCIEFYQVLYAIVATGRAVWQPVHYLPFDGLSSCV